MGVRILLSCVLLTASVSGAAAQDGDAEGSLSEIREMVLYARYREAIQAAQSFLGREDLSAETRNSALETLAVAQVASRQERHARETLATLYSRDPGHRLSDPDASPTVLSAFARARDAASTPVQVELEHESEAVLADRQSPSISVELAAGADAVHEVRLSYRYGGEDRWATLLMPRDGARAIARIPLSGSTEAYEIEYYVEALAPSLTPLAAIGSPDSPLTVGVPEATAAGAAGGIGVAAAGGDEGATSADEGGGVLSQWWFWTAVVVVLAGGAAAYVLFGPPSEGPPDGSLGNVTLGLW